MQLGIELPEVHYADTQAIHHHRGDAFVVAPPAAAASSGWLRKFGPSSTAFASGWMQIRGARRRRAVDRGFVLSDHADWDGLLGTIAATGAERIGVTHGYTSVLVRYLNEQGLDAFVMPARFAGDDAADQVDLADNRTDLPQDTGTIPEVDDAPATFGEAEE
jgi:putative mRNA 3-end processing factor